MEINMEPVYTSINNHSNDSFISRLRSKKFLTPFLVILILLGTLFTIQQVQKQQEVRKGAYANGANLTISASDTTPNVGDTITLTLNVVSNTIPLTGIEAHLNIPEDTFQVLNFDASGSTFSGTIKYGPVRRNNDYNFVRTNDPETPSSGSGKIAVITMKVLRAGTFTVNYLPLTQITGKDLPNENVIDTVSDAVITVAAPADPKVTLDFNPLQSDVAVGSTFTVDAMLDPKGLNVTAAQLNFAYPSTTLKLVRIEKGDMMEAILRDPEINNTNGTATISLGSDPNVVPTTKGVVAKLTFQALQLQAQPVQVLYSSTTKVTAMGKEESVLGTTTPYSVTVSQNPAPTVTPTLTPTLSVKRFVGSYEDKDGNPLTIPGLKVVLKNTDTGAIVGESVSSPNWEFTNLTSNNYQLIATPIANYTITHDVCFGCVKENVFHNGNNPSMSFGNRTYIGVTFKYTPNAIPTLSPTPTIGQPTISPTPTAVVIGTTLRLSLKMPTIGITIGEENTDPKRRDRSLWIQLLNATGQSVYTNDTNFINYIETTGRYTGTIGLPSTIPTGTYTVKVRFDNTLIKSLGTVTITAGGINTAPLASFFSGDIARDNTLDIFDYNVLVSCYGARAGTEFCGGNELIANLDDSKTIGAGGLDDPKLAVGSIDYNIMLTSFRDARDGD